LKIKYDLFTWQNKKFTYYCDQAVIEVGSAVSLKYFDLVFNFSVVTFLK